MSDITTPQEQPENRHVVVYDDESQDHVRSEFFKLQIGLQNGYAMALSLCRAPEISASQTVRDVEVQQK